MKKGSLGLGGAHSGNGSRTGKSKKTVWKEPEENVGFGKGRKKEGLPFVKYLLLLQ